MSSSRVHKGEKKMEVNEDDDEAEAPTPTPTPTPKSLDLEEKLSNYREPIRQPFIYKVQNHYLRDINDKVHEPRMVAIGPYHHGKQSLKMMEQHKLRYLKSLLLRENESVSRYLSAVAEIEEEARSCYAEELSYLSSDEFTQMLVLDACFIIELVRRSLNPDSSDPIFQMDWILELLRHDLIFCSRIRFLSSSSASFSTSLTKSRTTKTRMGSSSSSRLIDSFFTFLELEGPYRSKEEEVRHLLHLTHATLRPSSDVYINLNPCPLQREFRLIPSATELKDANVMFRTCEGGLLEAGFDNKGVLRMPPLYIGDDAQSFFRNLIFYEQYFPDDRATYVTDYVVMLDCLVNTAQDVEILSRCGIIENTMGDNQAAADIINRLTYFAILGRKNGDTFDRINAHYKRRWNRARAALNRDYFNTPWAYISFLAALLLLILTLLQTVFSAP